MIIRFFNLTDPAGPDGAERLMIGIETPDPDRGQMREAVRLATAADVDNYPQAYDEYRAAFDPPAGPEDPAEEA